MSVNGENEEKRLCFSLLSESGNKINLLCNKTQRGISAQAAGTSLCALCSSLCEISRRNQKSEEFLSFVSQFSVRRSLRCERCGICRNSKISPHCCFLPKIKHHRIYKTWGWAYWNFNVIPTDAAALHQLLSKARAGCVRFTTKVKINQSLNPFSSP